MVCLVDLDGFKAVNDAGGHAAGDAMLKAVATALGGAVRETDTVARLGGDEFAVLADVSVSFSGEMLAERLRAGRRRRWAPRRGVTASVGVAEVEPGDDVEDLMHRADAAMYRSKTAGGNRVTALATDRACAPSVDLAPAAPPSARRPWDDARTARHRGPSSGGCWATLGRHSTRRDARPVRSSSRVTEPGEVVSRTRGRARTSGDRGG